MRQPDEEGRGMKFHLYKDSKGEWRFRIKSRNGKIPGEQGYSRKVDCVKAIHAIIKACRTVEESKLIVDDSKPSKPMEEPEELEY